VKKRPPRRWVRFDANGPACAVARPRTPARRSQTAQRYRFLFGGVSHVGGRLLQRARVNARARGGTHKGDPLAWARICHLNQAVWEVHRLRCLFHEPRAHPRAGAHFVDRRLPVSQASCEFIGRFLRCCHVTRIAQRRDGRYPQQVTGRRYVGFRRSRHRARQVKSRWRRSACGAG